MDSNNVDLRSYCGQGLLTLGPGVTGFYYIHGNYLWAETYALATICNLYLQ